MISKIFTGDMPELMENILNNLNNEIYSLYSCALVSRHWCKMSIPILWQNPFSFDLSPLFISNYFSFLGESEKLGLKKFGINTEFSKTIFDYARFLKFLDLSLLECRVDNWIDLEHFDSYYLSKNHIVNLLLKLFIESGATLHKLDLNIFESLVIEPEIFDSLGENTQFFSHLQSLCLSALPNHEFSVGITTELLIILSDKAAKINTLEIILNAADPELFQALLCVIESQEKLKKFLICSLISIEEFYGIISALESQKNTLQEFIISVPGSCSEEFEVLKNCKNLEILRISYCEDAELLKKLNYKISTLQIIGGSIDASTMVQILEESGTLLQRIFIKEITSGSESIEIWEKSLLEAFMSFCPNITYLDISIIGFSTQLLKLIGNLQKLQFLTLRCDVEDMPKEELKKRVIQFAEILPVTLQYLDFRDTWLKPYIDILLNHCNASLKKLLIYHHDNEKNTKALVEFCKRNRTLNYVGVNKYLKLDDNIRKELETFVTLVPYECIVVDC